MMIWCKQKHTNVHMVSYFSILSSFSWMKLSIGLEWNEMSGSWCSQLHLGSEIESKREVNSAYWTMCASFKSIRTLSEIQTCSNEVVSHLSLVWWPICCCLMWISFVVRSSSSALYSEKQQQFFLAISSNFYRINATYTFLCLTWCEPFAVRWFIASYISVSADSAVGVVVT